MVDTSRCRRSCRKKASMPAPSTISDLQNRILSRIDPSVAWIYYNRKIFKDHERLCAAARTFSLHSRDPLRSPLADSRVGMVPGFPGQLET